MLILAAAFRTTGYDFLDFFFFFFKDLEILALTKEDFLFFLIQSSQFSFEIGEYGICRIRSSTGPFCTSSQSVFFPKMFSAPP